MPVLSVLLLLAGQDDPVVSRYRERTRAEPVCAAPGDGRDIMVCGRRTADRYRVPLTTLHARDDVPAERSALLEPKIAGCGRVGAFFHDCGYVGATMTAGRGRVTVRPRALAP